MAHHKSALKAIRRTERSSMVNGARIARIRTFIKKVEQAIAEGQKDTAVSNLRLAESELMRGVQKGALHRNAASRKVSRLSKKIQAIAS